MLRPERPASQTSVSCVPLLELRDLCKSFADTLAVNHVSFALQRGQILALLGENGAGKSTVIKLLAGIHQPDHGFMLLDGEPIDRRRENRLAFIHQDHGLIDTMTIAENIAQVRERIIAAACRTGRNPEEITLMGVSKTFPVESIREAHDAGLRVFGENRVQEFANKVDAVRDLPGTEWHLIGHLQTNKSAKAAELFDAIDSVDSVRMAEKLNAFAESASKREPDVPEVTITWRSAWPNLASTAA